MSNDKYEYMVNTWVEAEGRFVPNMFLIRTDKKCNSIKEINALKDNLYCDSNKQHVIMSVILLKKVSLLERLYFKLKNKFEKKAK